MTNLFSHVSTYRTTIDLQLIKDSVLCKVFPTTLKGFTQEWYQGLESGSIFCFSQLTQLFTTWFVICIPIKKVSTDIQKLFQKEDESLQDFVKRFNKEAVQVDDFESVEDDDDDDDDEDEDDEDEDEDEDDDEDEDEGRVRKKVQDLSNALSLIII